MASTFLEALQQGLQQARVRLSSNEPLPAVLFHYTNARGLIGLLEKRQVWATDGRFLNDSSELDYARNVVADAASAVEAQLKSPHAKYLCAKLVGLDRTDVWIGNTYVASFSKVPDLLSQWRAYGDDGLGYALGLSTDVSLEPALDVADPAGVLPPVAHFKQVVYDRSGTGGALWDAVTSIVRMVEELDSESGMVRANFAFDSIVDVVRDIYTVLKNHGFHEEEEWRLVFENLPAGGFLEPLAFRPGPQGVTPYVPLRWRAPEHQPPLVKLVAGPRVPIERGASALFMMLLANGYSSGCGDVKVEISHSTVSYRR